MKLVRGNLWDSPDDLILVTTNSYIRNDGALVMGRGAALELKNRFSGIDHELGWLVSKYGERSNLGIRYGLILAGIINWSSYSRLYGIFQVKYHFKDKANLELIDYSTKYLVNWCESWPNMKVSMNFPGIGYGQLSREEVLPIISILSDNVTVYEYGN